MNNIITGNTKKFQGNGRKLGYPTANIDSASELKEGVYFGFADLAGFKNHPALIFIGSPVTLGENAKRIEAHLLDISDQDYYDQQITLMPKVYFRPNKKFDSLAELIAAMKADEAAGRRWFAEQKLAV